MWLKDQEYLTKGPYGVTVFQLADSKGRNELHFCISLLFSMDAKSLSVTEIFYFEFRDISRSLFSVPEVCCECFAFISTWPEQLWGVAALLPRYPFQIQSGVAALTPPVALKDCNQWPLIWLAQLSCCAVLMYCEQRQYPGPWRRRWKSCKRWLVGGRLSRAKMGQFQWSWL